MPSKKILTIFLSFMIFLFNISPVYAAEYTYDELGRLISAKYTDNASKTADYTYDAGGNITSVSGFVGEQTTETTTEAVQCEKVWNYSTGDNTSGFFSVNANEWSNAEVLAYNDLTLNKAVKLESNSTIQFTAPTAGTLILVTYSTKSSPAVKLNGTSCLVSSSGVTEIEITSSGTYTITKDTTNTYLYYLSFTYSEVALTPYIWNYTDGTNTDDFYTVSANGWNNAQQIAYKDMALTKAVKMETETSITFTAPRAGKLTVVTYSTNSAPKININGQAVSVSANGATEIEISENSLCTITKNTTNTYLYYMSFI